MTKSNPPRYKHTKEAKEKIRLSLLGNKRAKGTKWSEEAKMACSERMKGSKNPWWGKHISEKQKRIISITNKGKIVSEETRRKISESKKGEKSYLWKGGITPFNHAQRVLFKNTMQKLILERDRYTCQMCGIKGVALQVDHIQSWTDYVELRFDMNNCRTLCTKCHYKITFGKEMPKYIKTWGLNLKERKFCNV